MEFAPNYWLTCVLVDEDSGVSPTRLREALEDENIESRPLWKPMHQQPVYKQAEAILTGVSDRLFARGLCLPSGSALDEAEPAAGCRRGAQGIQSRLMLSVASPDDNRLDADASAAPQAG